MRVPDFTAGWLSAGGVSDNVCRDRCGQHCLDILEGGLRIELGQAMLPSSSRNSILDLSTDCLKRWMAVRNIDLEGPASHLPASLMHDVDSGLRGVLGL